MPLTNYVDPAQARPGDIVEFDGERKMLRGVVVRRTANSTTEIEVLCEDGCVYDVHWLTAKRINSLSHVITTAYGPCPTGTYR